MVRRSAILVRYRSLLQRAEKGLFGPWNFLSFLFRLACADERGGQTPAFKYPAELVEMPEAKRKEHDFITQGRVMKWYHARCEFRNIANHHLVKMHSFRIGGATALMAAGVDPSLIKNKGRWASDVYEVYCRVCKGRMLELSNLMSRADTNQWLSRNDGFFDTRACCCELGTEEEVSLSEEDGDSDSEAEVDEGSEKESAAEESEDEQDEAELGYEADYECRALYEVPRDRRQTWSRRYKRLNRKFSRPTPSEPPS